MPWPTRFTEAFGLQQPIVQGPFGGGLSSVALAAAVSEAGGLGSFGAQALDGEGISALVRQLRQATASPFAVNLWVPLGDEATPAQVGPAWDAAARALAPHFEALGLPVPELPAAFGPAYDEQVAALLEARPRVFSFIYGLPSAAVLAACRARGILTLGTATQVAEAEALAAAGVDAVVVSGSEAGGHRASFLGRPESAPALGALLPQVADRVALPLVAAGGVADGRGLLSAFLHGAQAVQVGTAFLACEESGASSAHRAALFGPGRHETELTRAFSGRLARGLVNPLLAEGRALQALPYPAQNALTAPLRRAAAEAGDASRLALWAGQNAPLLRHRRAAELFAFLLADAEARAQALPWA